MDANKLKVLRDIKYEIRETCANCKFGVFMSTSWGTCTKFSYEHLKHTGPPRDLSINSNGYCESHEWQTDKRDGLQLFEEFVKE